MTEPLTCQQVNALDLREAAETYRALFDAIDEGFCIIEVIFNDQKRPVDYRFIEVNPAFERQTGLKNVQGRLMRDLAPEHEEHWFLIYGKVAATGEPVRFINLAAALHRWFDVYAFPLRHGGPNRVAVLFKDITEKRRAHEALREREEQLRLIFESATEYAIIATDPDRLVTAWNSGAERMIGYRHEEIIGRSADIFFTPEDRAKGEHEKEVRRAAEHGRTANERWHVRKDGTRFWGSGLVFRLNDGRNTLRGFLKIMRDRTAERQSEQELRDNEERLRLAIATAELGTWEYDPATQKSQIDERTRSIFGIPPGVEATMEIHSQIVHPDDRERVREKIERVLRPHGDPHYQDEYRILRANDPEERWVRAVARAYFDPEGSPTRVVGTILDVTALMKAREVLTRRSEELEFLVEDRTKQLRETVQQLETFSYSVVHDMRAPLRSVRSFASILNEEYGPKLDDVARDYIRRLETSVTRMDSLITDVLTYTRLNSTEAMLSPVNLDQLVREIVEQYPDFHECRDCVRIQSPLPIVLGNRALLTQCVSNLLGNALKFIPVGHRAQAMVRAEKRADKVRIWFEDNGIGIEPRYHGRIFGLFQRLHGPDKYAGTGVGLAIVQKAVERMQGQVGVESVPGEGSRFWIELLVPGASA